MVPAPPPLPTRFPCWCRAVYSWGGESKRDLGFIEGDLIECLNAGDGSWWVGRLYRDRRTVGSFPSNFVEVLPAEFRPHTRSISPMPGSKFTPDPKNTAAPAKSKTFRKPFEAYAKAPHYTSAKIPTTFRETPPKERARDTSTASFVPGVRDEINRAPSPAPPPPRPAQSFASRPPSRSPSPQPPMMNSYHSRPPSRATSPAPSLHYSSSFRHGQAQPDSPPPPAPPPHRHVGRQNPPPSPQDENKYMSRHGSNASYTPYRPSRQNSASSYADHDTRQDRQEPYAPYRQGSFSHHHDDEWHMSGAHAPRSPSPAPVNNMTPSPLREAMDGVMEQLGEIGTWGGNQEEDDYQGDSPSPSPSVDLWSPESFDMVSHKSTRRARHAPRPKTSMGVTHSDEGYETWSGESSHDGQSAGHSRHASDLPQLDSYVERMEKQFSVMHRSGSGSSRTGDMGPPPPPKGGQSLERPKSSMEERPASPERKLRARKSAYEISRTYTTKTNTTNSSAGNQSNTSHSTQSTNRTLWSGISAGGFSNTSAGSMARNQIRAQTAIGTRESDLERPESPFTGVTYHSSHASDVQVASRPASQAAFQDDSGLGGLVQPKPAKRNIFKKIFDSAKTGVASNRGSIAAGYPTSPTKSSPFSRSIGNSSTAMLQSTSSGIGNSTPGSRDAAKDMGLGSGGTDWVQVRRDVNRSNSLSRIERAERRERCQMLDHPALNPVDELYESVEGDEGADGNPVFDPVNYQAINLSQVDKSSRFLNGFPPMTNAITLATTYVCRPFRSEVQRLRAIFTWVSEKVMWEEDFEGEIHTTRVIQSKRACAEEYAMLVHEMCMAIGIHCEVVRGYLKSPGEVPDLNMLPRSNHWWNAVVVDGEWRFLDCCLASPSNPKRGHFSSASNTTADPWWFLTRPLEACWTHVPEHHSQQHILPPVAHEILLNLPCTCPSFFRNGIEMVDYNTSVNRIEDLEMVHLKFNVPADMEVVAEVETKAYTQDMDGDVFESGDTIKKRALAQAEWFNGVKRFTVKAVMPGDEGQGILKIYTGKRGLMHSIKDIPHPLTFALPMVHAGENPPYDFVTRHPTPHAQRHDIYVVQPQCRRLALNNTFVFAIRQHPSSLTSGPQSALTPSSNPGATSPVPFARPGSAMSMRGGGSTTSASNPSSASGTVSGKKPAKLAIQTPGGKILRLMRKEDRKGISVGSNRGMASEEEVSDGGTWETIIKCSEKGLWRGLVLADRTARWCVFAEWVCEG